MNIVNKNKNTVKKSTSISKKNTIKNRNLELNKKKKVQKIEYKELNKKQKLKYSLIFIIIMLLPYIVIVSLFNINSAIDNTWAMIVVIIIAFLWLFSMPFFIIKYVKFIGNKKIISKKIIKTQKYKNKKYKLQHSK